MEARVETDGQLFYAILEPDDGADPVTFKADDRRVVIDQAWHFLQERGYESEDADEILQEALMRFETEDD